MSLEELNSRYNKIKCLQKMYEDREKSLKESIEKRSSMLDIKKEASIVVSKAVEDTYLGLQTNITDIVNKALSVVFGDSYRMSFEINQRGNNTKNTNVLIKLSKDGVELSKDLTECCEGGVLAICSIILRTAFLLLNKENRRVLLLDEVLGSLSREEGPDGVSALNKGYDILQKLSKNFGIQIIIVSHTGVGE